MRGAEEKQEVWFRVDCGGAAGLGHLFRCLALAEALPADTKVSWFTTEPGAGQWVSVSGLVNPSAPEGGRCRLLVVDLPGGSDDWAESLRSIAPRSLFIAPPPGSVELGSDDVALYFDPRTAQQADHRHGEVMSGPSLIPLRSGLAQRRREPGGRIFVYGGAEDPHNLLWFLAQVERPFDFLIHEPSYGRERLAHLRNEIKPPAAIHLNLAAPWELMARAEFGITGFGTVVFELMALGVPVAAFPQQERREMACDYFAQAGALVPLRSAEIPLLFRSKLPSFPPSEEHGERGRKLVDGLGASRVWGLLFEDRG